MTLTWFDWGVMPESGVRCSSPQQVQELNVSSYPTQSKWLNEKNVNVNIIKMGVLILNRVANLTNFLFWSKELKSSAFENDTYIPYNYELDPVHW